MKFDKLKDYHSTQGMSQALAKSYVQPIHWHLMISLMAGIGFGFFLLIFLNSGMSKASVAAVKDAGVKQVGKIKDSISVLLPSLQVNSPVAPPLPTLTRPMTVLIMGVDSNGQGADRFKGTRSDTIMLASLDVNSKKVGLLSIPRDSRVNIYGHGMDKINAAHAMGGPELTRNVISDVWSVPIDHYVVIDTKGLKRLFEFIGPVEVLVEKPMHYKDNAGHLEVNLEPGLQTLSPAQLEGYVRFRHDALGDIGRIKRQQWFMRQVTQKLKDPQVVFRLPELLMMANDFVETDMSFEEMASVASFLKDIKQKQIESAMLPGHSQMISGGSYWLPDMDASQKVVDRLIKHQETPVQLASYDEYVQYTKDANAQKAARGQITVGILYAKGTETSARLLEKLLAEKGYRVKYSYMGNWVDCQHEQIIEGSSPLEDSELASLRENVPLLSDWPVVLQTGEHRSTDLVLVLSPAQSVLIAESAGNEFPVVPISTQKQAAH